MLCVVACINDCMNIKTFFYNNVIVRVQCTSITIYYLYYKESCFGSTIEHCFVSVTGQGFATIICVTHLFSMGTTSHRLAGLAPTSSGSLYTWAPSTWWASWWCARQPSGTRSAGRPTSPRSSAPYRTLSRSRTTCWSGWRSRRLPRTHNKQWGTVDFRVS